MWSQQIVGLFSRLLGKRSVFKKVQFLLTEPICGCETCQIAWSLPLNQEGQPTLRLTCNTCAATLIVGNSAFVGSFVFDKPYPKETKPGKLAPVLHLVVPKE